MSVELLEEDGVLVEPPQAGVPAAAAAAAAVAPASSTSPSTSESAPSATADSAAKGAIPVGAIPTYTISSAMASALAKKVDEAERATDTPQPKKDGKLDALSVQLPHLPSPFDAIYPRSRGGAEWKSIVDDGHCMMCQITPGDGKGNVPVLNRVYVNVVGKLANGTTFFDFPVEELDFTLGQAQVPKGLEMAICQMSLGQHCLLRCYPDYGFSTTRRPPMVPIDATLFLEVTVLRWEKEKNLHEMTLDDKWAYCDQRRAFGKDAFLTGKKPRTACKQYEKALTVLDSILNHENSPTVVGRKNDLLVLFWANQAQCWMKVLDYSRAIELCNKCLVVCPRHPKALFRRAECRKAREEWEDARKDYQSLLDLHAEQLEGKETKHEKLDPLVVVACQKSLKLIASKKTAQAQAQRKKFDGFMTRGGDKAELYEDMPTEAPPTPAAAASPVDASMAASSSSPTSSAGKAQPVEDDFAWLAQHSDGPPSLWARLTAATMRGVAFVRSFCGKKKAQLQQEAQAKKTE